MRFITSIALFLLLSSGQNAKAGDTLRHPHTIYLRLATGPLTYALKLKVPNGYGYHGRSAFLMPLQLSYGKTFKSGSEGLVHMAYYDKVGFAFPSEAYYGKKNYTLIMSGEKRWFFFPKETVRPFIGFYTPVSYSHVTEIYYDYGIRDPRPINGTSPLNTLTFGLGASMGFRIQYHRWNYVVYAQWHSVVLDRQSFNNASYFYYFHGQFFGTGFQLGYSF